MFIFYYFIESFLLSFDSTFYKRWSILDIGIKSSHYPKDLQEVFANEGMWRTNLTTNQGAFVALDEAHEMAYNKVLKGETYIILSL